MLIIPGRLKHISFLIMLCAVLIISSCQRERSRSEGHIFDRGGEDHEYTVVPANNRSYFPISQALIRDARSTIDCLIYQVRCYAAQPDSPSNMLLSELVAAVKRGVKVRFLFEISHWNPENTFYNRTAAELLSGQGIEVRYDDPNVNSHNKLIIIDQNVVITGSANWSYYSLKKNNESNVAVRSSRLAGQVTEYFNGLFKQASPTFPEIYPSTTPEGLASQKEGTVRLMSRFFEIETDSAGQMILKLANADHIVVPSILEDELRALFGTDLSGLRDGDLTMLVQIPAKGSAVGDFRLVGLEKPSPSKKIFDRKLFPCSLGEIEITPASLWSSGYMAENVQPLLNREYFPEVEHEIGKASEAVKIIQIQSDYFSARSRQAPPPQTNKLAWALMNKLKAGVPVEFLTEYRRGETFSLEKRSFLNRIQKSGGKVYLDDGVVTTHCKLLVLDHSSLIIGSTNWSLPALEANNEASLLIRSADLADYYDLYFQRLIKGQYKH